MALTCQSPELGTPAFYQCHDLTGITIGTNVTSIGFEAFYYCTNLTSVSIPNSVTSIGDFTFFGCFDLTSVTIPGSVTSIGQEVFTFCSSLIAITVNTNNPGYSSVNGVLFDKGQDTLIECPGGLGGSYTIPSSATSIAAYALDATADQRLDPQQHHQYRERCVQ